MKKMAPYLLSIAVGAGIPLLAGTTALTSAWIDFGAADWLASSASPSMSPAQGLLLLKLPYLFVAFLVGVLVCRLSNRLWFNLAATAALTFFLTQCLCLYTTGTIGNLFSSGWTITLRVVAWDAIAIPIILLAAWLFHKRTRPLPSAVDEATTL